MKIGIVGLGIMGSGMARNFLKAKHQVFVWNRTVAVAEKMKTSGAVVCLTPSEVAKSAEIVFEVTANSESSKSVWLGKEGILSGASQKSILVASATLSVQWVDELALKCKELGFSFMDVAMTGGRIGAETGSLTLLCGGKEETLHHIKPALEAVAKKVLHFGPEGQGMRYKLILNFLQAVHIIGFGQAMQIAKDQQMDLQKVAEALTDRPGGVVTEIAQKAYFKEPDPVTFSIEWLTKDLTYAKDLASKLDVKLLDDVLLEYKKAVEDGFGGKDWASVNVL